jgi:hypothetical protein
MPADTHDSIARERGLVAADLEGENNNIPR